MATPRKLTVTDAHLAEALAGRAYLLFDGGMGTLVQAAGLHTVHEVPDLLNLTHPEAIVAIQRQYVEAGAARGGARAARPRPRHGATQRGLAPHSGWRDRLRRGP